MTEIIGPILPPYYVPGFGCPATVVDEGESLSVASVFCDCGRGTSSIFLGPLLRALAWRAACVHLHLGHSGLWHGDLAAALGRDEDLVDFMLQVLDAIGATEHGTTVNGSWLTGVGWRLLWYYELTSGEVRP